LGFISKKWKGCLSLASWPDWPRGTSNLLYLPQPEVTVSLVLRSFYVGFEVLTAVVMKSTIFWDITV
jgi:hypothetical protein